MSLIEDAPVASTIDLLDQPWVFSQTRLLGEREFTNEAKKRGLYISPGQIEQLHRRGILIPFFRIWPRRVTSPISLPNEGQASSVYSLLHVAATRGHLTDPAEHPFERWPRRWPERDFRYSEYQLLTLRHLTTIWQAFKLVRSEDRHNWDLPPPPEPIRDVLHRSRVLAVLLEMLAPRYRSRILRTIRSPSDELFQYIDDNHPLDSWTPLLSNLDLVFQQAQHLLRRASSFDPLGKWSRVVRVGRPRQWGELRYDALVALDYRIAAEQILLFLEDLSDSTRIPASPVSRIRSQELKGRLAIDERLRAETLLDFGLTDVPAVVVALEGKTEMQIAPKVLSLMGLDEYQGSIQFVNLKSVDGDVRLLARAIAVPRVDIGQHDASLLRPLTALIIAVDEEKKYATADGRQQLEHAVVDEILTSLPHSLRTTLMRSDLEYLVRIRTWGADGPFEFAHFSDVEIAQAILELTGKADLSVRDLTKIVAKHRSGDKNVELIWKKWRSIKLTKPKLATALWPVLKSRILTEHPSRPVPIRDVLLEAVKLAGQLPVVRALRTTDP